MNKNFRIIISVALLGWLAYRTDWNQVGDAFDQLQVQWWLAALGLYLLSQLVSALRWQVLARPLGFQNSLVQFTGFYFIGMYFNLFLPTSVGGDVVRAWYLDGGSGRRLSAFLTAFVDRLSGLLVLLVIACAAMAFCPIAVPSWVEYCVWATGLSAVAGLVSMPVLARLTGRFSRVRRLTHDAKLYLSHPRPMLLSVALSIFVQASNVIIVWLVAQALNCSVPASYYWIFVPMVTLLTMLPVSLNGMGVREGGMVLFLTPLGVSEGAALSLAFLWFFVYTAASLVGGGVYLFGRFPRPQVQRDHEPVHSDSDQGRVRQYRAAA